MILKPHNVVIKPHNVTAKPHKIILKSHSVIVKPLEILKHNFVVHTRVYKTAPHRTYIPDF